ncbi:hypothetical protein FIU87_03630 [Bacillus sp. THAF10]|uniref:hypothetical protein n=1 Tax=Bacillus sp. THAF10 TaxID=2587848 RepID=UPI0012687DE4|nr:hypothetical protein [Bacillus sp. THAF10]QFT87734.1 hypothetical protein FIU87_03630 [Bacillus sp. THAF10]
MKKMWMFLFVILSFGISIFVSVNYLAGEKLEWVTLFSVPFSMIIVLVTFIFLPKQDSFNRYKKGIENIFLTLMLVLEIVHIGLVFYHMDSKFPIIMLLPICVGLVLIATANTLPRFQLEIPLSSSDLTKTIHQSWNKGLRLFSRPLFIGGLAMMLCVFLPQPLILPGFLTVLACTLLTSVAFSLKRA